MTYKHGVYGEQIPYAGEIAKKALGTVPVYIGTAPIHLINTTGDDEYDYSSLVNTPILINNLAEAKAKIGYSDDWESFTLSEVVKAHFDNGVANIGPIIVVNMADPGTVEGSDTVATVTLSGATANKIGYLDDPLAAIENVVVTATPSITSSDYKLTYEDDMIKINITKADFAASSCTATYKQVDVSDTAITASDFETAIAAIDMCEALLATIPNILAAPKYSAKPTYHAKMIAKAISKISQKWYLTCVSDIPASDAVDTVALALAWKVTNVYNSKYDKICWPRAYYAGQTYYLSTLAVVAMQSQDTAVDGVPYISASNKQINASSIVLDDNTIVFIDEVTANSMNAKGITTTNLIRGSLRLWGPHNANYNYDGLDDILPEDRQDASIRTMLYLLNYLQYNYLDEVDKPISKRDIDSIKASVQQWLNSLVNEGKLLYAVIDFLASENDATDMAGGDFVFNVTTTTTPNAKSITFKVQYSLAGLATLTGGEA